MSRSRLVSQRASGSRPRWTRLTALGAGLVLSAGCYNYVPAELAAVPPGEEVRVRMTRAGAEDLARTLESDEIRVEVSGEYEGLQNDAVLLRMPVVRDPTGVQSRIEQVVRLQEGEVLTVDRRELSVGKTAALVGVGAAGVGLFLTQVFDVFSDPGRNGDDMQVSVIPVLRWVFGR